VTWAGLRAVIADLIELLAGATPSPATTTVVALASMGVPALALLWGFLKMIKKIAIPNLVDAYTRLQHVRGRNEAQTTVAAALAERGSPDDLIRGLEVLRQVSPMDAPGSGLFIGDQPNAAIPTPRSSTPRREHRRVVIVNPGPLVDHTPSGEGTT
jgi:hypothetical protein